MTPVTTSIQISQIKATLLAQLDVCHSPSNLPRHKGSSTTGTLMIEQDSITRIHAIRLTVVHRDPIRIQFGTAIRGSRVERRRLTLRRFYYFSVQFGSGGLIESDVFFESTSTDGIEETKGAQAIDVPSVFCHFKGHFDVRLGTKVVNFGGLHLGDDVHQVSTIRKIAVVKFKLCRPW